MSTIARVLVVAWLVAALVVLGMDGRLHTFLAVVGPSSLVVLGLSAVVRHQLAPSRYTGHRNRSGTDWPTILTSRLPWSWPWRNEKLHHNRPGVSQRSHRQRPLRR